MTKEEAIEIADKFYGKEVEMTILDSMLLKSLWEVCGMDKSLPQIAQEVPPRSARYQNLFTFLSNHELSILPNESTKHD